MTKQMPGQKTGEIRREESMARHTSWRVGGPAEIFFMPESITELAEFLADLPEDKPVLWVGLGSNLLVRDNGIRGAVIATHRLLRKIDALGENRVRAEAGVACARLARFCAREGLGPAEFFAGIPGTLGGALAMNASAFGGETWDHVIRVETIARDGSLHARDRSDYEIAYRSVSGPADEWFVAATLEFDVDARDGRSAIRELLARRKATQPIGLPSCGSVFRNPPGDYAARLIEAAGLKGHSIGGAQVSPKHANFIINTGDATATDIERLIEHVRNVVAREHNVRLIQEVRIVGDTA